MSWQGLTDTSNLAILPNKNIQREYNHVLQLREQYACKKILEREEKQDPHPSWGGLPGGILHSLSQRKSCVGASGILSHAGRIRPGTRAALPRSGVLYCRGGDGFSQSAGGYPIPWSRRAEAPCLRGCVGLRNHPGRV